MAKHLIVLLAWAASEELRSATGPTDHREYLSTTSMSSRLRWISVHFWNYATIQSRDHSLEVPLIEDLWLLGGQEP